MADFAVRHNFTSILSPSHFIDAGFKDWLSVDLDLCQELRYELDRSGGNDIAVDFQIITSASSLRDSEFRFSLIDYIADLPIENVWVRASGFGATATGVGTRTFIERIRDLHAINRPIIADEVGGLAGLSAGAFGAVGGICHGVGMKEHFQINQWRQPPRPIGGSFGQKKRIYIRDLDRYLTADQFEVFANARGARSRFVCRDTTCCARGYEDMIDDSHIHFLTQRSRQISDLSRTPESRRVDHFLSQHVLPVVRRTRYALRLNLGDEQLINALNKNKERVVRIEEALSNLHENDEAASRSRSPEFRGDRKTVVFRHGG